MLALVMVFGNVNRNSGVGRFQQGAAVGEACYVLKDIGVFDGLGGCFTPDKWGMAGDEDSGNGERIEIVPSEAADDDCAGAANVGFGDFFGSQWLGDRDGAVEVIGVGGAEARNRAACLGPGGSELRVRVDDATDGREFAIEQGVGVEIA